MAKKTPQELGWCSFTFKLDIFTYPRQALLLCLFPDSDRLLGHFHLLPPYSWSPLCSWTMSEKAVDGCRISGLTNRVPEGDMGYSVLCQGQHRQRLSLVFVNEPFLSFWNHLATKSCVFYRPQTAICHYGTVWPVNTIYGPIYRGYSNIWNEYDF